MGAWREEESRWLFSLNAGVGSSPIHLGSFMLLPAHSIVLISFLLYMVRSFWQLINVYIQPQPFGIHLLWMEKAGLGLVQGSASPRPFLSLFLLMEVTWVLRRDLLNLALTFWCFSLCGEMLKMPEKWGVKWLFNCVQMRSSEEGTQRARQEFCKSNLTQSHFLTLGSKWVSTWLKIPQELGGSLKSCW